LEVLTIIGTNPPLTFLHHKNHNTKNLAEKNKFTKYNQIDLVTVIWPILISLKNPATTPLFQVFVR